MLQIAFYGILFSPAVSCKSQVVPEASENVAWHSSVVYIETQGTRWMIISRLGVFLWLKPTCVVVACRYVVIDCSAMMTAVECSV